MLHGNPTWSFYYRELVMALSPTQRCVVPDHIGMGLSEKPRDYAYTLERRIADIEALVMFGARAMIDLADDPARARAMGGAGRERVVAEYAIERTVSRLQLLYDEVLNP